LLYKIVIYRFSKKPFKGILSSDERLKRTRNAAEQKRSFVDENKEAISLKVDVITSFIVR
jgi:hypothetical protein